MSIEITDNVSQLNRSLFNEFIFNEEHQYVYDEYVEYERGLVRSQMGFWQLGRRQYGRSYEYTLTGIDLDDDFDVPTIVLTSSSGAFIGEIRTDVETPIIHSLKVTIEKGNCKEFELKLVQKPDFPIFAFTFIQIKLGASQTPIYYGKVTEDPELTDKDDIYTYKGVGIGEDLDNVNVDTNTEYTLGTDYGEIVLDLATTILADETKIVIDTNRIDQPVGIPLSGDINFGNTSIDKVLKTLALGSGYLYGVDADKTFFWEAQSQSVNKTYILGYNLHEFKTKWNREKIRNTIIGERITDKGSGGSGYTVGGVVSDTASVNKYGKRQKETKLPGNLSNDDITQIISAELEELKEPELTATARTYYLNKSTDIPTQGYSRIIMPFDTIYPVYNSCDDAETDFVKIGSGSLAITNDSDFFVAGQNAMNLSYGAGSNGDRAEYVSVFSKKIEKVIFWYKSENSGQVLKVGIGDGVWDDYNTIVTAPTTSVEQFNKFTWDLSEFMPTNIDRIAFEIQDINDGEIIIDQIIFVAKGYDTYILKNNKWTYNFSPTGNFIDFEFGEVPKKLSNFIAGLQAQQQEFNYINEVR